MNKKQIEKDAINIAHQILDDYARDYLTSCEYDEDTDQKVYEQIVSGLRIQIKRT